MKKHLIYILSVIVGTTLALSSCNKFDDSEPDMSNDVYNSDREATETTTTLAALKAEYKDFVNNNRDRWQSKIDEDITFDGYVYANDISGNIYQSIYVRKGDDAIVVGINDNSLWTTYPVGTHVVINLKGLYVGSYGNMMKIGAPYITSFGNIKLGGMPKFMAASNIKVIGRNENAPEVQPVLIDAAWLRTAARDMHKWTPMLVHIKNAEILGAVPPNGGERRKVYAVYDDKDDGNGVDNSLIFDGLTYTLRQSVLSTFSSDTIPVGKVNVTAVLTRYNSEWQFLLRNADDVEPVE